MEIELDVPDAGGMLIKIAATELSHSDLSVENSSRWTNWWAPKSAWTESTKTLTSSLRAKQSHSSSGLA